MGILGCRRKDAPAFLILHAKFPSAELSEIQQLEFNPFTEGWALPKDAAVVSSLRSKSELSKFHKVLKAVKVGESRRNHPIICGTYTLRILWKDETYYLFCTCGSDKDGEFVLIKSGPAGETNTNKMEIFESRDLSQLLRQNFGPPKNGN
jgi:hypothetical protein